jgi:hypothetical protein
LKEALGLGKVISLTFEGAVFGGVVFEDVVEEGEEASEGKDGSSLALAKVCQS